jgi:hypothetical protein
MAFEGFAAIVELLERRTVEVGRNEAVEPRLAGFEAGQVETGRLSRFDSS